MHRRTQVLAVLVAAAVVALGAGCANRQTSIDGDPPVVQVSTSAAGEVKRR